MAGEQPWLHDLVTVLSAPTVALSDSAGQIRAGHAPAGGAQTIDATPLWACLLHDAWCWGMPAAEVAALPPALRTALDWIRDDGDCDGDGLLEYATTTGRGLAKPRLAGLRRLHPVR